LPQINTMETKHFYLSNVEKNGLINIMKVLFGIACIAVALYWVIFRINSTGNFGTIWITILFLSGFGLYEIWSGLGKADRYIEIGKETIKLKRFLFSGPLEITASATFKIELFPLNIVFLMKTGKKVVLRFGTTYNDINGKISDEITRFAEENKITTEFIHEEI
jgi:hypothetical protein